MAEILSLFRHPVKGLSPEALDAADLVAGGCFPFDRMFALENGPSGFNPALAEHMPKIRFLMLMRHERLARLETRYAPATGILTIRQGGSTAASGDTRTVAGRRAIESFFESYMGDALRGPVRLLEAPPNFRFMDSRSGYVSILSRATITAIASAVGRESLDPRRFRGNILIDGWQAFAENDLVGRRIRIGDVEFDILKRIDRCAATDVDPRAGIRDLNLVGALERAFGHHDCGVYARIVTSGTIRPGDQLRIPD